MTSTPAPNSHRLPSADAPLTPSAAPRPRFELTLAQVSGSALAAATASIAASTLGVAGTIIGAIVGSLVATVGGAVYVHSLRHAGTRLRRTLPIITGPAAGPAGATTDIPDEPISGRFRLAAGLVLGAAVALGGITAVESVLGHPLSNVSGTGTTLSTAATEIGGASHQSGTPRTVIPPAAVTPNPEPSATESPTTPETTPSTTPTPGPSTSAPAPTSTPGTHAPTPTPSTSSVPSPAPSTESSPVSGAPTTSTATPATSAPVTP